MMSPACRPALVESWLLSEKCLHQTQAQAPSPNGLEAFVLLQEPTIQYAY
jgi:hypothetical protein